MGNFSCDATDIWLESVGYFRKHTAPDNSSLFRTVSEQLFFTQALHLEVREACANYMSRFEEYFSTLIDGDFHSYLKCLRNSEIGGSYVEMIALSHLYKHDFLVFFKFAHLPVQATNNDYPDVFTLFWSEDDLHFDSVFTKEYIENAGYCQSLVYSMLYSSVFAIKDVPGIVNRMLQESPSPPPPFVDPSVLTPVGLQAPGGGGWNSFYCTTKRCSVVGNNSPNPGAVVPSTNRNQPYQQPTFIVENNRRESTETETPQPLPPPQDTNINIITSSLLRQHHRHQQPVPFPYKVAKALHPDLYRNTELDLWRDIKAGRLPSSARCDNSVDCSSSPPSSAVMAIGRKCLVSRRCVEIGIGTNPTEPDAETEADDRDLAALAMKSSSGSRRERGGGGSDEMCVGHIQELMPGKVSVFIEGFGVILDVNNEDVIPFNHCEGYSSGPPDHGHGHGPVS